MRVAVKVGPDRGVRVEILASVHVAQHRAASGDDHDRLALEPVAHLGERMPDVLVIEAGEGVHWRLAIGDWRFASAASKAATSFAECAADSVTLSRAAPRA